MIFGCRTSISGTNPNHSKLTGNGDERPGKRRTRARRDRDGRDAAAERTEGSIDGDYEALVRLLKENEELKDRALRVAAEMENLRRRTARDVHDARTYAVANFARDMLSVSDNLRRALDAIPGRGQGIGRCRLQGADRRRRDHRARHAVGAGAARGQEARRRKARNSIPNFHQAMFEVPNPDVPANTVVQVVQPGYSIGERVLRPAMVGVAKGGPKLGGGEAPVEPGPVNDRPRRTLE